MLLTMKSKIVPPPPGIFSAADIYSRRYWRRTQHIVNEFWVRWQKEFLLSLQKRCKWKKKCRNLQVDDVVLLKTENERNSWPLAIIENVYPDTNDLVRSADVRLSDGRTFHRPIGKIILLVERENDNIDSPPKEPNDPDLDVKSGGEPDVGG